MEAAFLALWPVVICVLAFVIWIASFSWDKERITDYVRERSGRIVSITWSPFGAGWFGEKGERIFDVVYYDQAGNQHFATCKTSLFTGVYWTEDRVSHGKASWFDSLSASKEVGNPFIRQIPEGAWQDVAEELNRLREENAQLRNQLSGLTVVSTTKCPSCGASLSNEATYCPACQIVLR